MLTLESCVARNADTLFTTVDGEVIAMDSNHENYYNLDAIGSTIWNIIENEHKIYDICIKLSQKYNAPREIIQRDTLSLLNEMKENGLLSV
jgi:hypothetical protein